MIKKNSNTSDTSSRVYVLFRMLKRVKRHIWKRCVNTFVGGCFFLMFDILLRKKLNYFLLKNKITFKTNRNFFFFNLIVRDSTQSIVTQTKNDYHSVYDVRMWLNFDDDDVGDVETDKIVRTSNVCLENTFIFITTLKSASEYFLH